MAAAVVLGGWYAGYMFWDPRPPDEPPYATYFDVFAPALIVAIGLPLCVLAGLLVGRRGWLTAAGHGLLALGALAMAYLASFVFFGGVLRRSRRSVHHQLAVADRCSARGARVPGCRLRSAGLAPRGEVICGLLPAVWAS